MAATGDQASANKSLHPIVVLAMEVVERGVDEPIAVPAAGLQRLRASLESHNGSESLKGTFVALVEFAYFLDACESSPKAGLAVLEIARFAVPELKRMGVGLGTALASAENAGRRYANFLGNAPVAADVPKVGEKPKSGLSISDFKRGPGRA